MATDKTSHKPIPTMPHSRQFKINFIGIAYK
jgi:hypothetical protein